MSKLILLSGGKTTAPLTQHLIKLGYDIAVFEPNMGAALVQKHGDRVISVMGLYEPQFANIAHNEAANQFANIFKDGVEGIATRVKTLSEWKAFTGSKLKLENWLPGYLHQSILNQTTRMLCLEKLNQRKVEMCITHEDITEQFGGLAHWAKARGIPTALVPHANHFAKPELSPDIHDTSICDALAVTLHQEKWYRARAYAGDMAMTGSPLFDRWDKYQVNREWAQKVLRLDPEKKTIVYMSSWGQGTNAHDDSYRFEEALEAIALAGFDQLIIKLHPGEAPGIEQEYHRFLTEMGTKALVTRQYFEIVLSAADMVVSLGPSNSVVDAAIMNVPSVCIKMPGYTFDHPAIPEVEPDEIRIAVDEYQKWDRDDFVFQMTGNQIGKAGKNVALWAHERIRSLG